MRSEPAQSVARVGASARFPGLEALPWITTAIALLLWNVLPGEVRPQAALWFFLASGLVLGMPHGALDLLRLWQRAHAEENSSGIRRFLLLCGIYLVPVAGVMLLWQLAPLATAGAFLVLTAWHWGAGSPRPGEPRSTAWARGVLVLAVPFLAHPEEALTYFAWMGAQRPDADLARTLAALFAAAAWTAFWIPPRSSVNRSRGLVELAVITVAGVALSPLASIALFFMFNHAWHAHVSWIRRDGPAHTLGYTLRRLATLHSLPALAGAACLVPVFWIQPQAGVSAEGTAAAYLQVLAALTVPHAWLAWRETRTPA